ncbi:MAG: hypothetical protein HUJ51_01905 [Eggerthellaceae bacterium]|nr:hypothetical protein [Eggerthellaceae bacterium]
MPTTLHNTAFRLNSRQRRYDRNAAVYHGHLVDNLDLACLLVKFDFDNTNHLGGGKTGEVCTRKPVEGSRCLPVFYVNFLDCSLFCS